jgi:hypothetical protein
VSASEVTKRAAEVFGDSSSASAPVAAAGTGATLGAGGWAQPARAAAIEMIRTFFTSLTLVDEAVAVHQNALSGFVLRSKWMVPESGTRVSVSRDNSREDDWWR